MIWTGCINGCTEPHPVNSRGWTVCPKVGTLPAEEDGVVARIRALPEAGATKSRDYGRGYAQAVRDVLAIIQTEVSCPSGDTDCTADCGRCKGTGTSPPSWPGRKTTRNLPCGCEGSCPHSEYPDAGREASVRCPWNCTVWPPDAPRTHAVDCPYAPGREATGDEVPESAKHPCGKTDPHTAHDWIEQTGVIDYEHYWCIGVTGREATAHLYAVPEVIGGCAVCGGHPLDPQHDVPAGRDTTCDHCNTTKDGVRWACIRPADHEPPHRVVVVRSAGREAT